MVGFDLGDVDPWVPFLAELRQAQMGDPVEVWLLGQAGDRQTTVPTNQAVDVPASVRHLGQADSHPIPVQRVSRSERANASPRGGRVASVRFPAEGDGRAPDA